MLSEPLILSRHGTATGLRGQNQSICKMLCLYHGMCLSNSQHFHAVVHYRSIRSGALAFSTQLKLNSLLGVDLIARMGQEYVMQHVFHRFKSVYFDSATILFRQGDAVQENSPIYILANGRVKVLVDPHFRAPPEKHEGVKLAATSEAAGCR
jgi:hypothetical protein